MPGMIEEGVTEGSGRMPDAAFALHVLSSFLPQRVVGNRAETLLASADVLRVTVHRAGGHRSMPYPAKDLIVVAAETATAL